MRLFRLSLRTSLLLVTVVAACSRGDKAADSGAAARTLVRAARVDSASLPGALAKPLADYSADEFHAFAQSLAFGGGTEQPRKCRGTTGCEEKAGKLTAARVDAVDGQDSLSVAQLGPNGTIVARASVTGAYEEARYHMRPGPYQYYVVVFPEVGGTAGWRLQQVDTTAGRRGLTQVATGVFKPCNHPYRKEKKYRAHFLSCANSHPNDSTLKMGLMQTSSDDPVWVSCAAGCCSIQ